MQIDYYEARFLNSEELILIKSSPLPPLAGRAGEELIPLNSSASWTKFKNLTPGPVSASFPIKPVFG